MMAVARARKIFSSDSTRLPNRVQKRFDVIRRQFDETGMVIRARPLVVKAMGETKVFDPAKEMIIEGYANYAEPDRWNEVIPKDAWDLQNYLKNPQFLREHDWHRIIGKAIEMQAKDEGLWYRASLGDPGVYPLTQDQQESRSLVAQGMLRMNSVGFIPHQWEWNEDDELLSYILVELLENSLVAIPMQQDSEITSVKHWRASMARKDGGGKDDQADQADDNNGGMDEEAKTLIKETHACSKDMHGMVKSLYDAKSAAKDDEENKALKAQVEKLTKELEDSKKAYAELEDETKGLLGELEEKGLIPKAE